MAGMRDLVVKVFMNPAGYVAGEREVVASSQRMTVAISKEAEKQVQATMKQQERLRALSAEYARVAAAAEEGSATQIAAMTRLEAAQKRLGVTSVSTAKTLDSIATKSTALGRTLTRNITLPVIAGLAIAGHEFIKFQQQMTLIQTQAGASHGEVMKQSKNILNFAASGQSPMGPIELSQGLYHLESLGMRGAKAMDALKVSATAAGMGIANLEDVTTAFGGAVVTGMKGTENFNHAMGTLVATIGAGNMRMGDLANAMSTGVLPAAKDVGISLPEIGAALAVLTDRGMGAQMAATRLRMTFSMMEAPTKAATVALADLGISHRKLADTLHQPNGLLKALVLLRAGMDSLHDPVRATQDLLNAFGKGRSGAGILTLVDSLDSSISSYGGKLKLIKKEQKDYLDQVAAYHKTAAYKISAAWAEIQASAIKMGKSVAPAIVDIAQALAGIVGAFTRIPGPIREVIGIFAILLATLGPILLIVGKITKAYMDMSRLWLASNTAIKGSNDQVILSNDEVAVSQAKVGQAAATSATQTQAAAEEEAAAMAAPTRAAQGAAAAQASVGTAATESATMVESAAAKESAAMATTAGSFGTAASKSALILGNLKSIAKIGALTVGITLLFDGMSTPGPKGFFEQIFGAGAIGWALGGPEGAMITITADLLYNIIKGSWNAPGEHFLGPTPAAGESKYVAGMYKGNLVVALGGTELARALQKATDGQKLTAHEIMLLRQQIAAERTESKHVGGFAGIGGHTKHANIANMTLAEAIKLGWVDKSTTMLVPGGSGSGSPTNRVGNSKMSAGKAKMLAFAKEALGKPYLWGGSGPNAFDCSGLVMWAFENGLGINLPHSTYSQVTMGKQTSEGSGGQVSKGKIRLGDVIFTNYGETEHGKYNAGPGHEGLVVGFTSNGTPIIEAAPTTGQKVQTYTGLSAFTGGAKFTTRDLGFHGAPWAKTAKDILAQQEAAINSQLNNALRQQQEQAKKDAAAKKRDAALKKAGNAAAAAVLTPLERELKSDKTTISADTIKGADPIKAYEKYIDDLRKAIGSLSQKIHSKKTNIYEKAKLQSELDKLNNDITVAAARYAKAIEDTIIKPIQQKLKDFSASEKGTKSATGYSNKLVAAYKEEIAYLEKEIDKLAADIKKHPSASAALKQAEKDLKNKLTVVQGYMAKALDEQATVAADAFIKTINSGYTNFEDEYKLLSTLGQYSSPSKLGVKLHGKTFNVGGTDLSSVPDQIGQVLSDELNVINQDIVEVKAKIKNSKGTAKKHYQSELAKLLQDQSTVQDETAQNLETILNNADQAYQSAIQQLDSALQTAEGDIIAQFEQQTQDYIDNVLAKKYYQNGMQTPLEAQLAAMQEQDNIASLKQAISDAQVQLINDISSGADTATIQRDKQAVTQAQRAYQEHELEIQATIQRRKMDEAYAKAVKQWTDQRTVEEYQLRQDLDAYNKSLEDGTGNVDDLNTILSKYGINMSGVNKKLFETDFPKVQQAFSGKGGLIDATNNLKKAFQALIDWVNSHTGSDVPGGSGSGGGGGGGGGGCFTEDTLVLMADGSEKPIVTIEVGDEILCFDFKIKKLVPTKVTVVARHEDDDARKTWVYETETRSLVGTPEHIVWDGKSWVPLGEAKSLTSLTDGRERILRTRYRTVENVYNLHVEHEDHNYIANGFLVHNMKQGVAMASGGVTKGKPILAMIGEGRENEAIAPLSTLQGMIASAVAQGGGGGGYELHVHFDGPIMPGTDLKKVAETLEPHLRAAMIRTQRRNVTTGIQ